VASKVDRKDPEYLERVRALPCPLAWTRTCWGRIEAHHAGKHPGVGMKAHDWTAIPLCTAHHRAWHRHEGPFDGWDKDKRRSWSDEQIAKAQRTLGLRDADGRPTREDLALVEF
jgi:hypothetical protein